MHDYILGEDYVNWEWIKHSDSRSLALAQAQGGQHLTIVDYSHPIENGTYDSFP